MGNVRKTKLVKIILGAFREPSTAFSVVELVERFKDDMNASTVYRILERLENEGILHSFSGINGLKWYAKPPETQPTGLVDNHSYFQCQACGKSESLTIDFNIPSISNHNVNSANLIITGQCNSCPAMS